MLWNRGMISIVALAGGVFPATLAQPAVAREELAKLSPPCGIPGGATGFGKTVAIDGYYIVIGTPYGSSSWGGACVYKREGTGWVAHATLLGSEVGFYDTFGFSVSIDGDLIVAGAPHFDMAGADLGFAYVFRREASEWIEEAKLVPSGSAMADYFGWSVAIEGDLAVVGARGENEGTGVAYVFRREGTTWVEEARLTASDAVSGEAFGWSVSISGHLVVVGAIRDDDACPGDPSCTSGSAYVFRRDGTNWVEEAKLTAADPHKNDTFGVSVSISGQRAVVGAFRADAQTTDSGAAYVFRRDGGNWEQEAKVGATDGAAFDDFGWCVAIEGELVVVGAPSHDAGGTRSGSAYLFKFYQTEWFEVDKLVASDAHTDGGIGLSLSVDGDLAIVGASSSAYLFSLAGDIPTLSQWGVLIMGLLILAGATIVIRRNRLRPQLSPNHAEAIRQRPAGRGMMAVMSSRQPVFLKENYHVSARVLLGVAPGAGLRTIDQSRGARRAGPGQSRAVHGRRIPHR